MDESSTASDGAEGMRVMDGWGQEENPDADLKIVSSDDWVLWVKSSDLAKFSPVFATMLNICRDSSSHDSPADATLHLTDSDIETAGQLAGVFYLLENMDNAEVIHPHMTGTLGLSMVTFIEKYDMKLILEAIKLHLYSLNAMFPPQGGQFVLVAAALGEWPLCGRLVMTLDERDGDFRQHDGSRHMRKMLDWRDWTPSITRQLSQISNNFLWAVCQAGTKQAKLSGYRRISYTGMGPDLAAIMQMCEKGDEAVTDWVQGSKSLWK